MTAPNKLSQALANVVGDTPDYRFYFLSELVKRSVQTPDGRPAGRIRDVVVKLATPYPHAAGLLLDHGWGKPPEFVLWERVTKFTPDRIVVDRAETDTPFQPYVDQPGWLLLHEHLMGQTILDIDGRRTKVVTDVHLLESKRRMLLVHVDVAPNGLIDRLGMRHRQQLISWRIFHPLSVEDAASDTVMLTVTRKQSKYLPGDDLVYALEELKRHEVSGKPSPEAAAAPTSLPLSRDYVAVSEEMRAGDVVRLLRAVPHEPDDVSDIYVVSATRVLESVVSLPVLVLAPDDAPVRTLTATPAAQALSVTPADTHRNVQHKFDHSTARILPVIDAQGTLLGIVRRVDFVR
ncbi:MAG TPA: CBS domain-containing protein [Opitutaceae bacterium]|nr:CBS domain-containing protein [Opitutaceae bacterium]